MIPFYKVNTYPIKPYLNLPDRISQIWFNKYTLILIIMILKLYLFKKTLINSLKTSESYTQLTCQTLSKYSSSLSSMPYYMTELSNKLIMKSINETNKGLLETLELIITGVEEIVLFTIEMVIGTYVCVLTATIDGAAGMAINATESVIDVANKTMITIASEIQDGADALESVVDGIIKAANKVEEIATGVDDESESTKLDFNKINTSLNQLKNWSIDPSVNEKLSSLQNQIPDFSDVKQFTESLINKPFSKVRSEIKSSNYKIIQASQLQNLPSKENNNPVCTTEQVSQFYQTLTNRIDFVTKVIIILLILLAILIIVPLIWMECQKWSRLTNISEDNTKDSMSKIMLYENKYSSPVGDYLTRFSTSYKPHIKWLVAYIASQDSLILLVVGISGLIVVIFQFVVILSISKNSSLSNGLSQFSSTLDKDISKDINQWTQNTNDLIYDKQEQINDDLFAWVEDSTLSVNNTINGFVDKMDEGIALVFNNTPLYSYVKNVVGCVIIDKLIKVEEGLTWVHDHSSVELPLIDDNFLFDILNDDFANSSATYTNFTSSKSIHNNKSSISNSSSVSLDSKGSTDIISKAENSMANVLRLLLEEYKKSILLELYISIGLIAIWVLQIIIGLIILYLKNLSGSRQSQKELNLNLNFTSYDISSPIELSNSEQDDYTEKYGVLSNPFEKLLPAVLPAVAPIVPKKDLVDETLDELIISDAKTYGDRGFQSDDDEGVSEILSYHQDRHLTNQSVSKRWFL